MFLRSSELLSSVPFDLVICDEGHRIKNLNIKISNVSFIQYRKSRFEMYILMFSHFSYLMKTWSFKLILSCFTVFFALLKYILAYVFYEYLIKINFKSNCYTTSAITTTYYCRRGRYLKLPNGFSVYANCICLTKKCIIIKPVKTRPFYNRNLF